MGGLAVLVQVFAFLTFGPLADYGSGRKHVSGAPSLDHWPCTPLPVPSLPRMLPEGSTLWCMCLVRGRRIALQQSEVPFLWETSPLVLMPRGWPFLAADADGRHAHRLVHVHPDPHAGGRILLVAGWGVPRPGKPGLWPRPHLLQQVGMLILASPFFGLTAAALTGAVAQPLKTLLRARHMGGSTPGRIQVCFCHVSLILCMQLPLGACGCAPGAPQGHSGRAKQQSPGDPGEGEVLMLACSC